MKLFRVLILCGLAAVCVTCDLGTSQPASNPVLVIGVDGLDPYIVMVMRRRAQLPNLNALMYRGAHGIMYSEEEIRSPALWTTAATGRPRSVHGIHDFVTGTKFWPKKQQSERQRLVTSDMRRVPALWNYAGDAGRSSVVVGWLNTWPAEDIEGVMVAPYVALGKSKQITIKGAVYADEARQVHPEDRWPELQDLIKDKSAIGSSTTRPFIGSAHGRLAQTYPILNRYEESLRWSLAHTETMYGITTSLIQSEQPDLTMVYFEGADSLSHRFWLFRESDAHIARTLRSLSLPSAKATSLGDTYQDVITEYYKYVDEKIGLLVEAVPENTTIIVISDHGFGGWQERVPPLSTTPFTGQHRIEGFVAMAGPNIPADSRLHGATLYDVAPTVLNTLGLAIPDELEGHVLRPTIPGKIRMLPETTTAEELERKELERLESLGYVE